MENQPSIVLQPRIGPLRHEPEDGCEESCATEGAIGQRQDASVECSLLKLSPDEEFLQRSPFKL
jgi:hypothetical protein